MVEKDTDTVLPRVKLVQFVAKALECFASLYFGNGTLKSYSQRKACLVDLGGCVCAVFVFAWLRRASDGWQPNRTLNLSNKVEKSGNSDPAEA